MSKKTKVLIVSEGDLNIDFLERVVTSRYKLLERGRIYTVDNAFVKIEKERPDVIIVNSMLPQFSDQHDQFLSAIKELKEYSPDIVFTYCIPKEREEDGWIKSNLDKIHNADVKYIINLSNLSRYELTDKLKCIMENDGIDFDRPKPEIDEAIFKKDVEALKRKLGY